jgi:hypothetical protein
MTLVSASMGEDYDDGSRIVLGRSGVRPLHVVAADEGVVITVGDRVRARASPLGRRLS